MSWLESAPVQCPACGQSFQARTADSINVTRMPKAREAILAGAFHVFSCSHCHAHVAVDRTFLYADMTRQHFVHVFRRALRSKWPACEDVAGESFWGAFAVAPPFAEEMARSFTVRAVFGLAELREKLVLWDAGLDDCLVELLKLELHTRAPELHQALDAEIYVDAIDKAAGRIEVEVLRPGAAARHFGIPLSRYRAVEAAREDLIERHPGLFLKPFVNYRRLARERVRQ